MKQRKPQSPETVNRRREALKRYWADPAARQRQRALTKSRMAQPGISEKISERASAQARRKAIWQQLHPETKNGATGGREGRTKTGLANLAKPEAEAAPRYDEAASEATLNGKVPR